jgi:hypothetical protein
MYLRVNLSTYRWLSHKYKTKRLRRFDHILSITTSPLSETLLVALAGMCFFFTPKSFSATKARAGIVRWNRRGSTRHLFDPDPRETMMMPTQ